RDGETWTVVATDADRLPLKDTASSKASQQLAADEDELQRERKRLLKRKEALERELKELTTTPRAYAGMFEEPQPTRRFHRGDPMQPRETVDPGFLSFPAFRTSQSELPPKLPEAGRRLALARWISSPDHPLTARVIVNRLWLYHFGEGLV